MAKETTFTIIKPHAVANNNLGPILEMINRNGYRFIAMKMIRLTETLAKEFYREHADKSFFQDLIDYMTSGPIVVAIVSKSNAVSDFRELIGDTDPTQAKLGTIRRMFAESKEHNAIHGSDSDESARREIALFFTDQEIFA